MGGGGSKTHESFTVTPGGATTSPPADTPTDEAKAPSPLLEEALQQVAGLPEAPGPGDHLESGYAALVDGTHKTRASSARRSSPASPPRRSTRPGPS